MSADFNNQDFPLLRARIINIQEKGVDIDGMGTIDSNPTRMVYTIYPINCNVSYFIDCFIETEDGKGFFTDGNFLISLDSSKLNINSKFLLFVSFHDWLDIRVKKIKHEILEMAEFAFERLE